jgi:hypothetical protein
VYPRTLPAVVSTIPAESEALMIGAVPEELDLVVAKACSLLETSDTRTALPKVAALLRRVRRPKDGCGRPESAGGFVGFIPAALLDRL